jgi:tetraacyldisaccharide 4'-kinase
MPPKHWQSNKSILTQVLRPFAAVYGWLWSVRTTLYRAGILRSQSMPVPVVVVGNVVAGGAGKTPIVIALVKRLQAQGLNVGVVSRGFGRTSKGCVEITKYSAASNDGDEPVLIHHTTQAPVFVANSRVAAARALLEHYPNTQVVVCDDGLQHLALSRDIEVVVFDERGTGNNHFIPAGPLREPWPRSPQCQAHFVLSNVTRSHGSYVINGKGEQIALTKLAKKQIHALAGIAKPEAFFDMLRAQGMTLVSEQSFSDHDSLAKARIPSGQHDVLLCTAKDAVKLWQHHPQVLAVPLFIDLDTGFLKAFDASVQALITASPPSSHHLI